MKAAVISGTGLFTPEESISNQELVEAYNQYVILHNQEHAQAIAAGEMEPLPPSSEEFIIKASGIHSRYVLNKSGILDPRIMAPRLPERSEDEQSIMCEMAVKAATQALEQAGKTAADIDFVLVACSNMERPYPAVSVEVQDALGIEGFAFDMNVACSSASFGMQTAVDAIRNQSARAVLMVNPEICSAHLNFRDRDCHFIFGDVCTAAVIELEETCTSQVAWRILGTKLLTKFSNNIRNNFGFLNHTRPESANAADKLFHQQGRKVFKEVVPMVADVITQHLQQLEIPVDEVKRLWLHQANLSMNHLIGKKVYGREPLPEETPVVLDRYANTSSAGTLIAFHLYSEDLKKDDKGVLCSFGAGYSIGSVAMQKLR